MTQEQAVRMLESAMRYIAARYGATWAHHLLALALTQVRGCML